MSSVAQPVLLSKQLARRDVSLEIALNSAVGRPKGTVLFVNGYNCEKGYWTAQLPLVEDGYDVVRFNPRGMGLSQLGETPRDRYFEFSAEDMLSICAQLGIRHPHIVAHDMGALSVVIDDVHLRCGAKRARIAQDILERRYNAGRRAVFINSNLSPEELIQFGDYDKTLATRILSRCREMFYRVHIDDAEDYRDKIGGAVSEAIESLFGEQEPDSKPPGG